MSEPSALLHIKDIVIAIAAFTGMGMSFYNLHRENQKEKVKLKVIPKSIKQYGVTGSGESFNITTSNEFHGKNSNDLFAIEVINLSKFEVTIDEVGFHYHREIARATIANPILGDKGTWPRKLKSRESVTVYCKLSHILKEFSLPKVKNAYAVTSCQETCVGNSKALKGLSEFARKFA